MRVYSEAQNEHLKIPSEKIPVYAIALRPLSHVSEFAFLKMKKWVGVPKASKRRQSISRHYNPIPVDNPTRYAET